MKFLSMLVWLEEGGLVRAEHGGWLDELEVVWDLLWSVEGDPLGGEGLPAFGVSVLNSARVGARPRGG